MNGIVKMFGQKLTLNKGEMNTGYLVGMMRTPLRFSCQLRLNQNRLARAGNGLDLRKSASAVHQPVYLLR